MNLKRIGMKLERIPTNLKFGENCYCNGMNNSESRICRGFSSI